MKRELLQDKLAAKIIEGIRCGQYPMGSLLPKELELVESEKLSRFGSVEIFVSGVVLPVSS